MTNQPLPLTAHQIRAARALLGWSQKELAERSSVTRRTIALIEEGKSAQYQRTDARLRETFEALGVGFQNDGNRTIGVTLTVQPELTISE